MIAGTGIDIVEISRVKDAVERWGDRFLRRVFTDSELAYCMAKRNPYPHLAARFAAKEAAIKALGEAGIGQGQAGRSPAITVHAREIEVVNEPSGRPSVHFSEAVFPFDCVVGEVTAHVTISHEKRYAVAAVVLELDR